jgi:putative PIN family toxin of toxin-antitoxin system
MRALLDTNVIVSAVTTRGLCADVFRAVVSEHELITCPTILQEVERILRTKFLVPGDLISEYLELVGQDAIVAESAGVPDILIKDKDDLAIVAAAFNARAQVLVTGDRALQGITSIEKVRIVSPRAFWEELTAQQGDAPAGR